ncbi:hypothetical protein [Cryptosporangium sp. NPDC048952]|uniref:hypothetical protein n=1 Tax=Cryptosporangium sp. NPDC048952 TaxID=3363961 RepID=UPI003712BDE6
MNETLIMTWRPGVSAEESFTGPPVDAAPAQLQAALDEGLARTLLRLENVAEEN